MTARKALAAVKREIRAAARARVTVGAACNNQC